MEKITSLRAFIEQARRDHALVEIDEIIDPVYEAAHMARRFDGRPVLFTHLKNYPGWRTVVGALSSREGIAAALGVAKPDVLHALAGALAEPQPNPMWEGGPPPCQQIIIDDVDLDAIPIFKHLPTDGGPYVTSGVAIINDPDFGPNACFHRLMVTGPRTFTARIVEGRGTHTALMKSGGDLPIAICIGNSPQVMLAASMSPEKGVNELHIAHALGDTPLAKCITSDLLIPAESELIIEGRLTKNLGDEGPFLDLTETYDFVRQQPILEVDAVTHRRDPIYHALLPGRLEHKLLMGMPREPTIFAEVDKVTRCLGVHITPGGTSWLHAVVAIEPGGPDDAKEAVAAAFRGHTSLKHVVIVNGDVDIYDMADIEWAIATRFQADRDLVIMSDQRGSSLDPSAQHAPGEKARTAKMGMDATIPWGADPAEFKRNV